MKILEVCLFSAGADGVWERVKKESEFLSKNHEVKVFSTNLIKGSEGKAKENDLIGKVKIKRFSAIKPGAGKLKFIPGGESFMFWDFEKEAIKFNPDLIIAHVYRHPHTKKALNIKNKLKNFGKKCKVVLVTHAPFERKNSRSIFGNLSVWFYDNFLGKKILSQFDKIIYISKWEIPYLNKLGVDKKKLFYIPNWIEDVFFNHSKKDEPKKDILYMGRVSPIKDIETLLISMKNLKNQKLLIYGPAEKDYLNTLNTLIKKMSLKNVKIINKRYNRSEQIKILDSHNLFILPSKSEGHPQSLIEAMARGKIVISSDNLAAKDLIKEGRNGFLFKIGDFNNLEGKLNLCINLDQKTKQAIIENSIKKAAEFRWKNLRNTFLEVIK